MTELRVLTGNLYRLIRAVPPWTLRRSKCVRLLDAAAPVLIATQEMTEKQEKDLIERLAGNWRSFDQVNVGLLWRTDLVKIAPKPAFNDNTGVWRGTMRGGGRKRYCVIVRFRVRATGEVFTVVSAHLSTGEPRAAFWRTNQIKTIVDWLEQFGVLDEPVLIMGDLNDKAASTEPGVAFELRARGFSDAYDVLPADGFVNREFNTHQGFLAPRRSEPPKRLDRIYLNAKARMLGAEVILTGQASDHNFVTGRVALGGDPMNVDTPAVTVAADFTTILTQRPIDTMSVRKLNRARVGGHLSRYAGVAQEWLEQSTVTGRWREADQEAFDDFRRSLGFTGNDQIGAIGIASLTRLAERAKERGIRTFPVTD